MWRITGQTSDDVFDLLKLKEKVVVDATFESLESPKFNSWFSYVIETICTIRHQTSLWSHGKCLAHNQPLDDVFNQLQCGKQTFQESVAGRFVLQTCFATHHSDEKLANHLLRRKRRCCGEKCNKIGEASAEEVTEQSHKYD